MKQMGVDTPVFGFVSDYMSCPNGGDIKTGKTGPGSPGAAQRPLRVQGGFTVEVARRLEVVHEAFAAGSKMATALSMIRDLRLRRRDVTCSSPEFAHGLDLEAASRTWYEDETASQGTPLGDPTTTAPTSGLAIRSFPPATRRYGPRAACLGSA